MSGRNYQSRGSALPRGRREREEGRYARKAAEVLPIVHKRQDQLEAQLLSHIDDVVQALQAVFAVVDVPPRLVEELVPDPVGVDGVLSGDGCPVAEAPNPDDLVFGLKIRGGDQRLAWWMRWDKLTSDICFMDLSMSSFLLRWPSHHALVPVRQCQNSVFEQRFQQRRQTYRLST